MDRTALCIELTIYGVIFMQFIVNCAVCHAFDYFVLLQYCILCLVK
jgi:hypothetical protein